MGILTKTLNKNFDFEFITFDGKNMAEILSFISLRRLNSSKNIFDDFEKRPEAIPNLDEWDLQKWWEETGTITKKYYLSDQEYEVNSHTLGNMPAWRKDELFKVDMKLNTDGYMRVVFFKKGDTIVYCDNMELDDDANFIVLEGPMSDKDIEDYIKIHYDI